MTARPTNEQLIAKARAAFGDVTPTVPQLISFLHIGWMKATEVLAEMKQQKPTEKSWQQDRLL